MPSLRRPTAATIQAFLRAQAERDLTYAAVGATMATPPPGYVVDHTRIKLGQGEKVFRAARKALERWRHLDLCWLQAHPEDMRIEEGRVIAIVARSTGLWWVNACRVVAVVDDCGPLWRFGYAYGTLADHAASGEERFLVEWDRRAGDVWYDILAFSRPRHFLARLGYRWLRRVQRRFSRDSVAAMRQAVAEIVAAGQEA